jgi:hypothetical protein
VSCTVVPLLLEPPLELLLVLVPPELLVVPPPELLVVPPELELPRSEPLLPELPELLDVLWPEPLELLELLELVLEFSPDSEPLLLPDGAPLSLSVEDRVGFPPSAFPSVPSSVFAPVPDVAQAWSTPRIKATMQDGAERSSRFTGTPARAVAVTVDLT